MGIINNIKNRKPNLKEGYPSIEQNFAKYRETEDARAQTALKQNIVIHLTDLRLMSSYYKQLLDYLDYDYTLTNLRIESLRKRIPNERIVDFLKTPIAQQNKIAREAELEALRKYVKTVITHR